MKLPDDYTQQTPYNYDLAIGFLQIFDVLLNVSQVSNDVLLRELQHQNIDYLEEIKQTLMRIEKQNDDILKRLGDTDD